MQITTAIMLLFVTGAAWAQPHSPPQPETSAPAGAARDPAPEPAGIANDAAEPEIDPATGVPRVRSREDYEGLSPSERGIFNRVRRPAVTTFVDSSLDLIAPAGFDGRPGDVSIQRYAVAFGPAFRISDEADFAIRISGDWSIYNFSDASGLVPGVIDEELFDDARTFSITPVINSVNPDSWSWTAGLTLASSGESGADFDDTLSIGGLAIVSYPVTSTLRLGAGVVAQSGVARDDANIIPVPYIEWQISERLSLRTRQAGVALEYEPAFGWQLALQMGFEQRDFRLDDDGPLPGGGVIDTAVPLHFAVTYSPHPRFGFTARVGANVWGELDVYTDGGEQITDIERGAALSGGLSISVRF